MAMIPLVMIAMPATSGPDDPPEDMYFESHSGQYELEIMCDEESLGCKPSVMRMRRDSLVIWSREFDHTFKEAAVSDSGRVIGAFYHSDWRHEDELDPDGDQYGIWVTTLDKGGEELSSTSHKDNGFPVCSFPHDPVIRGINAFDSYNRAIVRTQERWNPQRANWWIYDLGSGDELIVQSPVLKDLENGWRSREVQVIELADTSLILVHWVIHEMGGPFASHTRISVHDSSGDELWHVQINDEYDNLGIEEVFSWRASRDWRKSPKLMMKVDQLQLTKGGFRFHSISKNEITEYRYASVDGALDVRVAGVRSKVFEFGDDEE